MHRYRATLQLPRRLHRPGSSKCFDRAETRFALQHKTPDNVAAGSGATFSITSSDIGYYLDSVRAAGSLRQARWQKDRASPMVSP